MRGRPVTTIALLLVLAASACGGDEAATTLPPPGTIPTSLVTTTSTTVPSTTATSPSTTTTTTVPPGPTTVPVTPGNRVIIGDDMEPETLNPLAPGGGNQVNWRIGQAIYAGLTEVHGETLEIVPDLAVEIPTVENGGVTVAADGTTTVVFRIRDEAVWEDGTPVTGDDVAYTYRAILGLEEPPADYTGYQALRSVVAGSAAKEVTLTFAAPTLAFETMFPVVLPRHQMEGTHPVEDWATPWLSAGPFRFESWEPGESITLVRNDAYWKTDPGTGEALPHLDRVVFRFIPDSELLMDAFTLGEIDLVLPWPWPALYDRIRRNEAADLQ